MYFVRKEIRVYAREYQQDPVTLVCRSYLSLFHLLCQLKECQWTVWKGL